MGLYAKYVLPHFVDLAMSNREARGLRASWIPRVRGEVLGVGIGSGLNLAFYSAEGVFDFDPSVELQQMARKRLGSIDVEFLSQSAEETIALADSSIDTVVLMWTLCSIADPQGALGKRSAA